MTCYREPESHRCPAQVRYREAVSQEPHGEAFRDEEYVCSECGAVFTAGELEALQVWDGDGYLTSP